MYNMMITITCLILLHGKNKTDVNLYAVASLSTKFSISGIF